MLTSRAAASATARPSSIPPTTTMWWPFLKARAFETARQAARTEGIFSGPFTGANLAAAVGVARRLGPGHRVVTVQGDSGLKYLAGHLYL